MSQLQTSPRPHLPAAGGRDEPRRYPPPPKPWMTEEEYLTWVWRQHDGEYEWINGRVVPLSPIDVRNDRLMHWFCALFNEFAKQSGIAGEAFGNNVQVRLPGSRRQPDVKFVRADGPAVVHETFIEGPPDVCVEIVSEDDPARDYVEKFAEYAAGGVREYWIVDPARSDRVYAWTLRGERYEPIPEADGRLASVVLPGFVFEVEWIKQHSLPRAGECVRQMGLTRP